MEVMLIRHADPNYKQDTITELGHRQAKALAQSLKNSRLDFLYVSPLGRAQATYRHIADVLNANSATLDWLKEIGLVCHKGTILTLLAYLLHWFLPYYIGKK